jgi:hypothetical protein
VKPAAVFVVLPLATAFGACSDRDRGNAVKPEPAPPRRVIDPPTRIDPLPPYAIRADGVGPYKLGESFSALRLAQGPQNPQVDIPGLIHHTIIPADDHAIVIGGELTGSVATFVAVLAPEVARTESGIHVGSSRDELVRALGGPVDDVTRARDPRLVVTSNLRNARFIVDGDRVAALVVAIDNHVPRAASDNGGCARPAAVERWFGACLTGSGELVDVDGDDITVRTTEGERASPPLHIPNLVFVAPLRNEVDGHDELIAVTRNDEAQQKSWFLIGFRFDGKVFQRVVDLLPLYQLSSTQTRWIGADLKDVDLYLDLTSRADGIEVGGLLTTRVGEKIRDVVVISTAQLARRRGKYPSPDASDAGVLDASENSKDGRSTGSGPKP